MDKLLKSLVVLLLGATLVTQLLMLRRMELTPSRYAPLTLADIVNAPPQMRRELLMRIPIVRIEGTVPVNGAVDCSIVESPLQVQIVR